MEKGGPAPAPGLSLDWGAMEGDKARQNPNYVCEVQKKRSISKEEFRRRDHPGRTSESRKIPGKKWP